MEAVANLYRSAGWDVRKGGWTEFEARSGARGAVFTTVTVAARFQSSFASTASMNASVMRTELFAFWYWIEAQSEESSDMS